MPQTYLQMILVRFNPVPIYCSGLTGVVPNEPGQEPELPTEPNVAQLRNVT